MAGHTYVGTNRIKKIWLGTTQIKKIWLGTTNVFSAGFEFTYTGQYEFTGSPDGDWQLKLLTSGTLNITSLPTLIDYFMIGGGKEGTDGIAGSGSGYYPGEYPQGGNGGDGGKYIQNTNGTSLEEKSYSVVIGSSDGETTFNDITTANGTASGTGAKNSGRGSYNGSKGNDGITAFDGNVYGAGGGSGSAGRDSSYSGGSGGNRGGGRGGNTNSSVKAEKGQPATANTGSGGGGGGAWSDYWIGYHYAESGGVGGTGILILRNHR